MTGEQLSVCRGAFEVDAAGRGEPAVLDTTGQYQSVLHRSRWLQRQGAWESCLKALGSSSPLVPPPAPDQRAPAHPNDGVLGFLKSCRASGVFFDGVDACGNAGVYFVDAKFIGNLQKHPTGA